MKKLVLVFPLIFLFYQEFMLEVCPNRFIINLHATYQITPKEVIGLTFDWLYLSSKWYIIPSIRQEN